MNKKKIGVILCLLLSLYVVFNGVSIYQYSRVDEAVHVEFGVVLGASSYNGEVSNVYRERLNHAIKLYEQDIINKIIVTGGVGKGAKVSDAKAAYNYLISRGISKENIILEELSTITEENLINSKRIIKSHGFNEAIIISDPLHMKRAKLLCDAINLPAYSSPTTTSMYRSLKTKGPFLARELFYYIAYKWKIFLSIS